MSPQTSGDLLKKYRITSGDIPDEICRAVSFQNSNTEGSLVREEITEILKVDSSKTDLPLIRLLFDNELAASEKSENGEVLYQLAYLLYVNEELEDVYRIYSAKYENNDPQSANTIEDDMLKMGKRIDRIIDLVEEDFLLKPHLKEKYKGILSVLEQMRDNPKEERMSGAVRELSTAGKVKGVADINFNQKVIMSNLTTVINYESDLAELEIGYLKEEATNVQFGYPSGVETRYYFNDADFTAAQQLAKKINDNEKDRSDHEPSSRPFIWWVGTGLLLFMIAFSLYIILFGA